MDDLEKMVRELDVLVTGKQSSGSPARFILDDWLFFDEQFYCSDGGYSRLFFSSEHGCVCLDSVSTNHAKMRWMQKDVMKLRSKINEISQKMVLNEDPNWKFHKM
jgi:hypothetical protein